MINIDKISLDVKEKFRNKVTITWNVLPQEVANIGPDFPLVLHGLNAKMG